MNTQITTAFQAAGTVQSAGGNTPFLVTDPETVHLVETGRVDVFLVRVENGEPVGVRTFLCHALPGEALFGMPETADDFGLLAVGGVGTQVRVLDNAQIKAADKDICTVLVTTFLCALGSAVQRFENPQLQTLLPSEGIVSTEAGHFLGVREGVIWVQAEGATARFAGGETVSVSDAFPIPEGVWLVPEQEGEWTCESSQTVLGGDRGWQGLRVFQTAVVTYLGQQVLQLAQKEQDRLTSKMQVDDETREKTLHGLATIMEMDASEISTDGGEDPAFAAFLSVGHVEGIQFLPPPRWQQLKKPSDTIRAICNASAVGHRQVVLRDDWWHSDLGALICLRTAAKDDEDPSVVAALPIKPGVYELYDPIAGSRRLLDEGVADGLEPFAYSFYRPLPAHKLSLMDLWRFMRHDLVQDMNTVLMVGGAGFVLGLVVPVMTGYLFNTVIPNASRGQLWEMFAGLLVATLAGALFELTRSFSMLRIETKANASLQMAVFDRVLRLPLGFFRGYSAGDLADRAGGINALRQALGGATIGAILSGVVSLGNFVLLFYYSSTLALVATGILFLNVIVTGSFAYFSMQFYRRLQDVAGKLSGLVLQLLTGIAKLRVSGAESRVFSVWAAQYHEQKQLAFRAGRLENFQQVFNSFIPVASSLAIFLVLMQMMRDDPTTALPTGDFIAFNAAFGTFLAAAVSLRNAHKINLSPPINLVN